MEKNQLFSETLVKGQETEFFSRIFFNLKHSQYLIINEYTFLYRFHAGSLTHNNQKYVIKNKESEVISLMDNFQRSLEINDAELANELYKRLLKILYLATVNNHKKNIEFVLNGIIKRIGSQNRVKLFLINLTVSIVVFFKIKNIQWHYLFKKFQLKI